MAVKKGDQVTVNYEGRFKDGEVFDSSSHGDHDHPLVFIVGSGMVIAGFDNAVIGMEEGEEKEIDIPKEEGYGEYKEDLKKSFPKSQFPQEKEIKEGVVIVLGSDDGRQFPAKIHKVNKEDIVIDLNHPLAGKDLIFKIKIVKIEDGK